MVEAAQTGQGSVHRASVTRIIDNKNEICICEGNGKSNNKAADRKSRGFIAMLLGWYPHAYSFAGVTLFLTLVPTAICCPGHR